MLGIIKCLQSTGINPSVTSLSPPLSLSPHFSLFISRSSNLLCNHFSVITIISSAIYNLYLFLSFFFFAPLYSLSLSLSTISLYLSSLCFDPPSPPSLTYLALPLFRSFFTSLYLYLTISLFLSLTLPPSVYFSLLTIRQTILNDNASRQLKVPGTSTARSLELSSDQSKVHRWELARVSTLFIFDSPSTQTLPLVLCLPW